MQSETYLRLNLALMWWSVGTAAALWLAPAQPLRAAQGLMTALLLATAWHSALTFQARAEQVQAVARLVCPAPPPHTAVRVLLGNGRRRRTRAA